MHFSSKTFHRVLAHREGTGIGSQLGDLSSGVLWRLRSPLKGARFPLPDYANNNRPVSLRGRGREENISGERILFWQVLLQENFLTACKAILCAWCPGLFPSLGTGP